MRTADYHAYLETRAWKGRRARALVRAGFCCQECGMFGVQLDVHHLTYDRLGRERDTDLRVLCRHCHDERHYPG